MALLQATGLLEISEQIIAITITARNSKVQQSVSRVDPNKILKIEITDLDENPIDFKYSIDRDDNELIIIVSSSDFKAKVDDNTISNQEKNGNVTQSISGSRNQMIGSHSGGTVIANYKGDLRS
jgi:hypothetical protein